MHFGKSVSSLHFLSEAGFIYRLLSSECRFIQRIFLCQSHTWYTYNR